jgi:4-hydroxyphenylpyruvate dioxygenase-like putative hemolysin
MSTTREISASRQQTGSSFPERASAVRSRAIRSRRVSLGLNISPNMTRGHSVVGVELGY